MRLTRKRRQRAGFACAATLVAACCAVPLLAQTQAAAPGTVVKVDSLPVYAQMDATSGVVQTLKKGQPVALNFEIQNASGTWCSVRMPSQSATLGFVLCHGLSIAKPKEQAESGPADAGEAGAASGESAAGAGRSVHLNLAPPVARSLSSYAQVQAFVVPQGMLDDSRLDELDSAARAGAPPAMDRAALGHLAAGSFELSHGDTSAALVQLSAAVSHAGKNPGIQFVSLLDLAYVHLQRGEYADALDPLERARAIAPNAVAVAQFSGWAYYGLNQLNRAVAEWKRAQQLRPDAQIAALLAKAERDANTERSFHSEANLHFVLRYEGGQAPALAGQVLSALETDFQTLQTDFQFTPPSRIGVVLYTSRTFRDVTRAPEWADGVNDGRIRIPAQNLTSVDANLARVLMHELTHSFVYQMTGGRCPTWLNEGLAQYMEGWRSNAGIAKQLLALYEKKKYIPLSRLEGPWTGFPAPVAEFAYAWGLAATESIVARSGLWGIEALFRQLAQGEPVSTAMGSALQLNYSDLELQTAQYLRQTYLP